MKSQEESRGWGNDQPLPFVDPAFVSSSWEWQGHSGRLEAGVNQWRFSGSDVNGSEEFENIMHWDDSGAREAFLVAKERHEAGSKGHAYPVALPSPDLYIQYIDWDKHEVYDLPDSADAPFARKEKGWTRRKGYRGGKGASRVAGPSVRQEPTESPRWKRINSENAPSAPTGWCDSQANPALSRWELPTAVRNSWTNIPAAVLDQPVSSGWNLGPQISTQAQWQGQTTTSGWQWQTEYSYNGWGGEAYHPAVQPATQSGWGHHLQTPGGLQNAYTIDNRRPILSPGQWDGRLGDRGSGGRWASQNQASGQHSQHQTRFGNVQRAYGGSSALNNRWERPRQQWHLDGSMHHGTELYFP